MKYTKVLGLALAALTFNACSDEWDEHYVAQPLGNGVSLWQTISTDANLSNFKMVLDSCGYEKVLNSSQVFTVFAPTNEYFTEQQAEAYIELYNLDKARNKKEKENRAVKEFVMNHIALYNHSVYSNYSDTIVLLNGKYLHLTDETAGEQSLISSNMPHGNGILYTVDGELSYLSNVLEQLGKVEGLDSIAAFFEEYNVYEFLPEKSIPGGIVNGQTVYLDSVTRLKNDLFEYVGKINDEDSTYWMVAPDNDMWKAMVDEYTNYFVYDDSVAKGDSLQYLYSRLAIIRGTVFSATQNPDESKYDSVKSTEAMDYKQRLTKYGSYDTYYYQYDKPYAPGGIFANVDEFECSNGILMKANAWNIDKSQTFSQLILTECETRGALAYIDKDVDGTQDSKNIKTQTTTVNVPTNSEYYNKISGNSFMKIAPTSGTNPSATFYVRDVLSMPYDIYVVVVPATAEDPRATENQRLPIKAIFKINYHDEKGASKLVTQQKDERIVLNNNVISNPEVIDTILVKSNVMIPTCSYGLQDAVPQVTITAESSVTNRQVQTKQYTQTMRLDAIILKPHVGEGEEIVIE
ncbi:MAG: fasciclin domain-containing protein [Bacteroidaceae bacterium]|nr:fasciclin domain-containing protein [Bacteroidaceae bacterium]